MQGLSRADAEGGAHEVEFELRQLFGRAKADGPGDLSDRFARAMATKIAAAAAKRGPIVIVVGWCEVFKEAQRRNFVTDGIDNMEFFEETILKAVSRSPYLKEKYAEMA